MKRVLTGILFLLLCGSTLLFAAGGVKEKRARAYDYGQVEMNNSSASAGIAPVRFDHWTHRSKYTCRLCHVDIAFEMKANATEVTAADNMQGYYCGVCHNGKSLYQGEVIFAACDPAEKKTDAARCQRCHLPAKDPQLKTAYYEFIKGLPSERFGNKIDWEKAEIEGLIKPIDYLEGISVKSPAMPVQKDFALEAKVEGMPDIIFSHRKHTDWNGCETCHPDIFVGVKKGSTQYTMIEIFDKKYCGVCHGSVAFPLQGCQRCHTEKVQ
jgi:c(7)-type cytochrome triheme protein